MLALKAALGLQPQSLRHCGSLILEGITANYCLCCGCYELPGFGAPMLLNSHEQPHLGASIHTLCCQLRSLI